MSFINIFIMCRRLENEQVSGVIYYNMQEQSNPRVTTSYCSVKMTNEHTLLMDINEVPKSLNIA